MDMQSVVYTYSGILFSLKNNGAHCYTWMSLEKTVLSEISQSQKVKHCVTPLIRGAQSNQVTETESPYWVTGTNLMGRPGPSLWAFNSAWGTEA